jgi:hypothetical protein
VLGKELSFLVRSRIHGWREMFIVWLLASIYWALAVQNIWFVWVFILFGRLLVLFRIDIDMNILTIRTLVVVRSRLNGPNLISLS